MAQKQMTYAEWIETDQARSIGVEFLRVGRTNVVCVTDELYSWIVLKKDWDEVMRMRLERPADPADQADTYTDMCGLLYYQRDMIPAFEREHGPRQWA